MNKKEREAWYVERLRDLWRGFPAGPRTASENPDCLVGGDAETVGIEVTEFTLQANDGEQPTRELLSVRRQIIDRALTKYRERDGPVLLLDVEFDDRVRLTKADVEPLAEAIASCVSAHSFSEDEAPGWYQEVPGPLPAGVAAISGGRYRFAESWDAGSGGLVRECRFESLQDVIAKKAKRYQAYRAQCESVALLIVFSSEHDPRTEVTRDILQHTYASPFDWTIALLADIPEVVVLNTIPPLA